MLKAQRGDWRGRIKGPRVTVIIVTVVVKTVIMVTVVIVTVIIKTLFYNFVILPLVGRTFSAGHR